MGYSHPCSSPLQKWSLQYSSHEPSLQPPDLAFHSQRENSSSSPRSCVFWLGLGLPFVGHFCSSGFLGYSSRLGVYSHVLTWASLPCFWPVDDCSADSVRQLSVSCPSAPGDPSCFAGLSRRWTLKTCFLQAQC